MTYFLKLPHSITKKPDIVNEVYLKNSQTTVPLDLFFVFMYLLVSCMLIKKFNVKENIYKLILVALTTIVLTAGFCKYFLSYPVTKNMFSRWFHAIKYNSIVYDVILVVFIFSVYIYLNNETKTNLLFCG